MNSESVLYKKENGMYWEVTKEQIILELLEANKSLEKKIDKAIEYIDNSTINPEDLTLYDNMTKEEYLKHFNIYY